MIHQCPNCGCNLKQYEPVSFGNVRIDARGDIYYRNKAVKLARSQRALVEALIQARGRCLTRGALANIINDEIDDITISKYVERARSAFRRLDPAFDQIEVVHGMGAYKWRPSAGVKLAA